MRWAGPRVGGKKERRGEDEGRERGESRAELASLARLLAHRRPPALRPPAGSHCLHRRGSPSPVAAPACPRLRSHAAESRPACRAHERPSVARQPAVPQALAQPPGRSRGPRGHGRALRKSGVGKSGGKALRTHRSLRWLLRGGGRPRGSEGLGAPTEEKPGGREGLEGPREFGNWGNWSNWDNRRIETLKTLFERKSLPPGHRGNGRGSGSNGT